MKKNTSAKQETVILTVMNALIRGFGLLLRVILSRLLGAEVMGISELAGSVHSLAITPLSSGLPVAISRMTAKAKKEHESLSLLAGISIVRIFSLVMMPLLLLFSPLIAQWLGDERVLPSLWVTAPCILVIGYSAIYNGYCYGIEQTRLPALSELLEQVVRVVVCVLLVLLLPNLQAPYLATIPILGLLIAEIVGMVFVLTALKMPIQSTTLGFPMRKPVLRLAAPSTLTRFVQTAVRSLTAIVIPIRLQVSGLSVAESTARLGMLNGMVMPIVMLPCIFTSALVMVALPKIAKVEDDLPSLRRLLVQCLGACFPIGIMSALLIYYGSTYLSIWLYHNADLITLFQACTPLCFLMTFGHVSTGLCTALGQQKRTLYGALLSSCLSLFLTYLWVGDEQYRLYGVIWAMILSQAISILYNAFILIRWWCSRHVINRA